MIAVLVALRDFFVAILVSWLGVAVEPADNQQQAEPVQPSHSQTAMIG
ncbi:hypothetical protein [Henriciella aquimarina]|nr:hypothetical protein [Henriciella aquimarina]